MENGEELSRCAWVRDLMWAHCPYIMANVGHDRAGNPISDKELEAVLSRMLDKVQMYSRFERGVRP